MLYGNFLEEELKKQGIVYPIIMVIEQLTGEALTKALQEAIAAFNQSTF